MDRAVLATGRFVVPALITLLPVTAYAHGDYSDMAAAAVGILIPLPSAIATLILVFISSRKLNVTSPQSHASYANAVTAVSFTLLGLCVLTAAGVLAQWSQPGLVALFWLPAVALCSLSGVLGIKLLRRNSAAVTAPQNVARETARPVCEVPNHSGADLAGKDMAGAALVGADLVGANLTGARLVGADLSRANLTGADLKGANLENANLQGALLTGASFQDTHLHDAAIDEQWQGVISGFRGLPRWVKP